MTETTETPQISSLYDKLTPYDAHGADIVWVLNDASPPCFVYLTIAIASRGGDAGGERMTSSQPHRLFPGLNPVSASWWARVEVDAERQRQRIKGGGILSGILDSRRVTKIKDLDKVRADKASPWIERTADLEVLAELRNHAIHGPAAQRAWEAWHSHEASKETKTLRHFWAMATGSKSVKAA